MGSFARGHDELKVAALAVLAFVTFTALFLYMTNRGLALSRSDLYIRLESAAGLRRGDPVYFRGVQVGELRNLAFTAGGGVVIRTRLTERLPLTTDAHATVVAADLFGRQTLVLNEGDFRAPRLLDGDTLRGVPPASMVVQMAELGRNAERLTGDTTVALLHAALAGTDLATRSVAQLGDQIRVLVAAQQEALALIARDAGTVAGNVAMATDPEALMRVRDQAERATTSLADAAARLDGTAASMTALLGHIANGEGSAGLLLRDPALYQRTEALLASMEALVLDIKANPRRYINVSVF